MSGNERTGTDQTRTQAVQTREEPSRQDTKGTQMSTNMNTQENIEQQEAQLYATCLSKLQAYFDDEIEGGYDVVTAIKAANMLVKREQSKGAREGKKTASQFNSGRI